MNFRDVELLSAYLDGRLNPSDAARLEGRLSSDPRLKATLEDLRETRGLLRRLPQRRAPRNFRLTPKMAGIKPPEPRAYPAFRFATALAGLLFVAAVALNAVTPFAASHLAAAPAPSYGMGGGGGGSGGAAEGPLQAPAPTEAPASTEAPPQAFTSILPTPTLESAPSIAQATVAAEDTARAKAAETATEQANQAAPMMQSVPVQEAPRSPVPLPWVLGLGGVMIASAAGAWAVRRSNERRIRERWKQK